MHYVVAKDFKSVNRVFSVGMPIKPDDVEGDISFDVWKERGFIEEASATFGILAAEKVVEPIQPNPPGH